MWSIRALRIHSPRRAISRIHRRTISRAPYNSDRVGDVGEGFCKVDGKALTPASPPSALRLSLVATGEGSSFPPLLRRRERGCRRSGGGGGRLLGSPTENAAGG